MDLPKNYFADPASSFLTFGQWFVLNFLPKNEHDPDIYFEPKMLEVGKIIEQKYVLKKDNKNE